MDNDSVTKQYLDERLTAMEDRLVEKIRDVQTELLGAFYDWQRPVEKRLARLRGGQQ